MMLRIIAAVALACVSLQLAGRAAQAAEADGSWASAPDACDKVFVKKGGRISFATQADMYGSGFVISGRQIRGKFAKCGVKLRKREGDTVHLVAACSTDVAVETVQFTFKLEGDDKMVRMFPGLPELATPYFRCRL
jgi:hypothetical protein